MSETKKNGIPIIVSNSYIKKYYLDERLNVLPKEVKDALKILFVKLTEEVGGIAKVIFYNDTYEIYTEMEKNDEDMLFDEINATYKLSKIERENEKIFSDIATFCKFKFNGIV